MCINIQELCHIPWHDAHYDVCINIPELHAHYDARHDEKNITNYKYVCLYNYEGRLNEKIKRIYLSLFTEQSILEATKFYKNYRDEDIYNRRGSFHFPANIFFEE